MIRTFAVLLIVVPAATYGQEKVDASLAQRQMFDRINSVVEPRAKELDLGRDVVTYCRIELNLHTERASKDGSIPYGVNYNQIKDAAELKIVIEAREAYETTFLLLCLSRAKQDLSVRK